MSARDVIDKVNATARWIPPMEADERPPAAIPYRLMTAADFASLPQHEWAVKPVLPRRGVAGLIGVSGAGKTFVELDLVAALAEGRDWFGFKIRRQHSVVCVVLEGDTGVRRRVSAWEACNGRPFPPSVRFLFEAFKITNVDDVSRLGTTIESAGGADVAFIDTLNRAAPDSDENSSADMGRILEGLKRLQALIDGLVVPVHHVGKDPTKGMRGHSSLHAALDAVIEVCHVEAGRQLRIAKCKDGEDGTELQFSLRVVELGDDEDGDPVTSCVVHQDEVQTDSTGRARRAGMPGAGSNQRIVLDALRPLFRDSRAFGRAGSPPTRPCLELEAAIDSIMGRLPVDAKRRRERAQQAIRGLVANGNVCANDGWIWLP